MWNWIKTLSPLRQAALGMGGVLYLGSSGLLFAMRPLGDAIVLWLATTAGLLISLQIEQFRADIAELRHQLWVNNGNLLEMHGTTAVRVDMLENRHNALADQVVRNLAPVASPRGGLRPLSTVPSVSPLRLDRINGRKRGPNDVS